MGNSPSSSSSSSNSYRQTLVVDEEFNKNHHMLIEMDSDMGRIIQKEEVTVDIVIAKMEGRQSSVYMVKEGSPPYIFFWLVESSMNARKQIREKYCIVGSNGSGCDNNNEEEYECQSNNTDVYYRIREGGGAHTFHSIEWNDGDQVDNSDSPNIIKQQQRWVVVKEPHLVDLYMVYLEMKGIEGSLLYILQKTSKSDNRAGDLMKLLEGNFQDLLKQQTEMRLLLLYFLNNDKEMGRSIGKSILDTDAHLFNELIKILNISQQ
jgi:hypothetical protein